MHIVSKAVRCHEGLPESKAAVLIGRGKGNLSHQIRLRCPRSPTRQETQQIQDAAGVCACHRGVRAAILISTTASRWAPRRRDCDVAAPAHIPSQVRRAAHIRSIEKDVNNAWVFLSYIGPSGTPSNLFAGVASCTYSTSNNHRLRQMPLARLHIHTDSDNTDGCKSQVCGWAGAPGLSQGRGCAKRVSAKGRNRHGMSLCCCVTRKDAMLKRTEQVSVACQFENNAFCMVSNIMVGPAHKPTNLFAAKLAKFTSLRAQAVLGSRGSPSYAHPVYTS
jgi:hypothetical protein